LGCLFLWFISFGQAKEMNIQIQNKIILKLSVLFYFFKIFESGIIFIFIAIKRVVMKNTVVLLLFVFTPFAVFSEINTGNSLEWLCADAGLIARGHIISYSKTNTEKNNFIIVFETKEIFKGTTESPVEIVTATIAEDSLKKYTEEKTPLLVFLQEGEKSFRDKKKKTPWHIMEACNAVSALINLAAPQQVLIKASTFTILGSREQIIAECRLSLKKIAGYEVQGKTVFMNYLTVPFQTQAYGLLYSGSTCYLAVPDFMFPDSREKPY
ncbi:MAG TPA: hypothetical protein PLB59_13075, partial [Bacteroidales bacterium]|nr:hypothetical protein [Bacteroidales bacterium]